MVSPESMTGLPSPAAWLTDALTTASASSTERTHAIVPGVSARIGGSGKGFIGTLGPDLAVVLMASNSLYFR